MLLPQTKVAVINEGVEHATRMSRDMCEVNDRDWLRKSLLQAWVDVDKRRI